MALVKVRSLGQYGVINDIAPFDLPLNAFTDAINVRFRNNRIETIGGWINIIPTLNAINTKYYTVVRRPLSSSYYFGSSDKILGLDLAASTSTYSNLTPVGETYNINPAVTPWESNNYKWTGGVLNELVFFNNPVHKPIGQQNIDNTSDKFIVLPGWGKPKKSAPTADYDWRAQKIVAYKNYLVAINMSEKAQVADADRKPFPNRVRWSNIGLEGGLPQDWIEDDEAKDGGFVNLIDATSDLLDGLQLGDNLMLYTGSETYRWSFVGGMDIFSNYKVFPDTGILNPGCVVEFEGQHFCVSQEDIFVHSGSLNSKQSVIEGRLRTRLFDEISKVNSKACRVYSYPSQKEIWITYPYNVNGGTLPNNQVWTVDRAAVWNWQYNTWTFTDIPDGFDFIMGQMIPPESAGWNTYTNAKTWLAEPSTSQWDVTVPGIGGDHIFTVSADGCLYLMDYGNTQLRISYADDGNGNIDVPVNTVTPVVRYVERRGIDFDDEASTSYSKKLVKLIVPQMDGKQTGTIRWNIGGCDVNGTAITQDNTSPFDPDVNYRIGVMSNQRYHWYKVEGLNGDAWTLSGWDGDVMVSSRR